MLLGEILVKEGFCEKADVILALEEQENGDPRKLGEILIGRHVINHFHLVMALGIQAETRENGKLDPAMV